MAKLPRVVVAGIPHHVIQRGNRSQRVFFSPEDKRLYLEILALQKKLFCVEVWAYCLMDNHVHLIVVPKEEGSLTQAIGETHKMYTRAINYRNEWRGCLWQGRYKSAPLDEKYLYSAIRYVERNPVRAGIVARAQDYEWSSAKAHVESEEDPVLDHFYLLDEISDWAEYIKMEENQRHLRQIRVNSHSGRPLGSEEFVIQLGQKTGRNLIKQRTGPKED